MSKKLKAIILTGGLALLAGIAGIIAYFTDTDQAQNVITVGKVDIVTEELNYTPDETGLRQNQVIQKDPKIQNTGLNPAIVFLKVTVPYKNVRVVTDAGTIPDKAYTELFWLLNEEPAANTTTTANSFNTKWIEIADPVTDTTAETKTYLFGYSQILPKDGATEALFNYVKYKAVMEGELSDGFDIDIIGYAIQADSIDDEAVTSYSETTFNSADAAAKKTALQELYQIYLANPADKG